MHTVFFLGGGGGLKRSMPKEGSIRDLFKVACTSGPLALVLNAYIVS